MDVSSVKIAALVFDPANARKHSKKNLDAIKGSLARFGQQKPIVVGRNNVVIAGNGTLTAAIDLGWTEIDVVETDLAGSEATAFALADNRTSELAEWDQEILGATLHALREESFDLDSIGFDTSYLDNLYSEVHQAEPAEGAQELSEDDFSKFAHQCPRCGFEFDAGGGKK